MILSDLLKNNREKENHDVKIGEVIPRNMLMISKPYSDKVRKGNDIESVSKNIQIIAKNSLELPFLSKNINMLRSGILSLNKIVLERNKRINLDNLKLREDIYESKFDKTPTKIDKKSDQSSGNMFSSDDIFDKIFDWGSTILGVSGLILKEYFKNPDFKKILDNTFSSLQDSLKNAFDRFSQSFFGDSGEKFNSNLTAIGIGLTTAIASVKLAFSFFSEILKSAGKLIAKSFGLEIPDISKSTDRQSKNKTYRSSETERSNTQEKDNRRIIRKKETGNDKDKIKRFKNFAEKVARNGWKDRLLSKLTKRFGYAIGLRAVAFITGMFVPVIGWIATAVAFGLLASEAYAIYDEIFRSGGIEDELENEDRELNKKVNVTTPNLENPNINTEKIDSMDSQSMQNTPTMIRSGFDYDRYTQIVGKKESSGNYKADNGLGYLGKYQFGAAALETYGYIKSGASKNNQYAVYSPENWTGKDGINNAFDFLNTPEIQEKVMRDYTKSHYNQLKKSAVISDDTSDTDVAGALYAAHHGGVGGANKYYLKGLDTQDRFLTGESVGKSARLMEDEYNKGKYLSNNLSSSSARLMTPDYNQGSYLNNSSREILDTSKNSQPIQMVDASTVNNINNGSGSQQPIQISQANVGDRDLMEMLLKNMWGN